MTRATLSGIAPFFIVADVPATLAFYRDKLGFEVTYNKEFYKNGQLALMSDDRQAIHIDFNSVYADGTPAGRGGEPFQDGTPNPNVGRPFVSDSGQFGNNSYKSDRESGRATVFLTHDFAREHRLCHRGIARRGWLGLGPA